MDENLSRRKLKGLVVDRQKQFRLAVTCASLIMLPSLIVSVSLMSDLALENVRLADAGLSPHDVADRLIELAIRYGIISISVFIALAIVSVYASVKLSNSIIGPVARLEIFVEAPHQ